jgi:hypothetical protein
MGAKKGNKYALGNKGGQPSLFKSSLELSLKISEYFDNCPDLKDIVTQAGIAKIPVYTICGLAYHLGFESRQSFYDYEKRKEYSYIIRQARLRIEMKYEQNLQFNSATGSIFALKNMDWHDKSEIDHSNKGDKFEPIDYSKLDDSILRAIAQASRRE